MTPEETRQAAAVMTAFAEGKCIEFNNGMGSGWQLCERPVWDWECIKYRVAPERWAGKIWVHQSGIVRDTGYFPDGPVIEGWRLIEAKQVEP